MAEFFVEITPTLDMERPKVLIGLKRDISTASDVDIEKYSNLQQLKEALVKLGVRRAEVESELKRIYASLKRDVLAGERAYFPVDITEEQAKHFGWKGEP